MIVKRFDVYLVGLDPTGGSEIQKTRLCLIISPDEMNRHIRTVIIAPMTSASKDYPTRVSCMVKKNDGHVVLDQIRTIDKDRLVKKLGAIDPKAQLEVSSVLQRMFALETGAGNARCSGVAGGTFYPAHQCPPPENVPPNSLST